MFKGQQDCQSQVMDLIEKFSSWRDESHRQMSNIISSHSRSISKGFNVIVQEVSDLQTEISALRKERNVLLETINNLNGDIRQMSTKEPSAEPEEDLNQDSDKLDASEMEILYIKEECVEPLGINYENDEEEKFFENGDNLHQNEHQQNNGYQMGDQDNLNESNVNEWASLVVNNSVQVGPDTDGPGDEVVRSDKEYRKTKGRNGKSSFTEKKNSKPHNPYHSKNLVCLVCDLTFSTNENLRIHFRNIHSKRKINNKGKNQGGDRKLTCEQCQYETTWQNALKRHIKTVHDKIRNRACSECTYITDRRDSLKRHMGSAHKLKT